MIKHIDPFVFEIKSKVADEFTVVYQQHLEEAKRCNFTACGCEWCEAYRKAVGND